MATTLTYTKARANLAKLLDKVSHDKEIVIINRKNAENIALISESELTGLLETAHLLRSPMNAKRLLKTLLDVKENEGKPQTIADIRKEFGLEE